MPTTQTVLPTQDPNALPLAPQTLPRPRAPTAPGQLPIASASPASPAPGAGQVPLAASPAVPSPTVQAPAQPIDRVALASSAFDTLQASRAPGDRRALEGVTSQAAGLGQLGSGQWRGALTNANNERQLQLDTQRDTLVNRATEGSIADASTAFQQSLAGAQQGLASELGRGNLALGREGLELARTGQEGELGLSRDQLELQTRLGLGGMNAEQQRIEIARQEQAAQAAYRAGTMTLAERDARLRELSNAQQFGLAQGSQAQTQQQIDLARRAQEAEEAYRAGTMTLAQRDAALRELQNSQENTRANIAQTNQAAQFAQTLAQQATQFGASQAQQLQIARLTDATQNRNLDLSSEQGRQQLMVQLAQIMGGPTGEVDPAFMAQIAQALGITMPGTTPPGTPPRPTPYTPPIVTPPRPTVRPELPLAEDPTQITSPR